MSADLHLQDFMRYPALPKQAADRESAGRQRLEILLRDAGAHARPPWVREVKLPVAINEERMAMRKEIDSRFRVDNYREAIRILYELIDNGGGAAHGFALYYIREGLMWARELPYAILEYRRALPDPGSHLKLGMCLLAYDQYSEALEQYSLAIAGAGASDTPAGMLRGQAYWSAGQLYQRIEQLETAAQAYAAAAAHYRGESANMKLPEGFRRSVLEHAAKMDEMVEFCRAVEAMDIARIPDGACTGTSQGYAGMIDVRVTVGSGRILSVEVTQHKETVTLDSLEVIPRRIVDEQRLNVAWVIGVKYTSRAIVAAAFRALQRAMKGP